jgi:glycosyltransferase involved in cell wall biosynthesis
MHLLMISGDRWVLRGKKSAFWYTLQEFSKHWERIDVICPHVPGAGERNVFPNVYFHPSPRGLWFQPWWIFRKGRELVAAHGHDVMTAHEYPPFYNGIGAAWLSHKTGVPLVLEIHHVVGHPVAASITERMGLTMSRQHLPGAIRKAAATRTVNASTKDLLVSYGAPAEKISVVPSFYLDAALLQPAAMAKEYDVVFCARLVANKGLAELLRAVASLPGVTLLVIGDGPEKSRGVRLAESLGIADRVRFAGWLPTQEDLVRMMQTAKVFVMCSKSEGGPRSALEAMACGMPLISTRVGVMPDVVRDGENALFITGTPEDIAAKIRTLLADDALRTRMGAEARKILDRFERTTLVKGYADFLKARARGTMAS